MKPSKTKMALLSMAGALAISAGAASAAVDTAYNANDLLLFFRNPNGTQGTTSIVGISLGSTWDVFRDAATPGDPSYGSIISLGNYNSILTSTYGADWTDLTSLSSIYAGAAGQNGNPANFGNTVSNGDASRTVYITKPRTGADQSTAPTVSSAGASGVASAISGANSSFSTSPGVKLNGETSTFGQNPIDLAGNTGVAYTGISGGVMGRLSSSMFSLGNIDNIVLALDLYRVSPNTSTTNNAWENSNNIQGYTATQGYYLGTITISSNGDVNFIAVPEPSTALLLGLGLSTVLFGMRRRKATV